MRRALGVLLVLTLTTMGGCAGDSVTSPGRAPASRPEAAAVIAVTPVATAPVSAMAVIDGFRVHPEPGEDGVLRIGSGQAVVINAGDIAARPPAPPSYLIVNWGEGPNQRVGCGPCRLEHSYTPGRYILEATADDLQPATAGSITSRSIRLTVEVTGRPDLRATISANPLRIGITTGTTTLTWSTQGADTVEVTGLGRVPSSGSAAVDPGVGVNTYEVVARRSSDGETARDSVDVILSSLQFFRFVPATIRAGQQTTVEYALPPPGTTFVLLRILCESSGNTGSTLVQNGPPQPIPGGTAISYTSTVPDTCFAEWIGQSGIIFRNESVGLIVR